MLYYWFFLVVVVFLILWLTVASESLPKNFHILHLTNTSYSMVKHIIRADILRVASNEQNVRAY